jgi:glycosyltransferase involved in cell wall biosynthesis
MTRDDHPPAATVPTGAREGAKPFVCMIAYTDYTVDGRVRREAEILASHGFRVLCLTTKNGSEPARFAQDGVEVRELRVTKYRGKSAVAYMSSYVRFLLSCSAACVGLLLRGKLDVVHVHNLPDFLVFAGAVPRLAGRKVILDVHDSVPETFATKFSSAPMIQTALRLEERFSSFIAHKVICVNHPQRDVLVGRGIPHDKTFVCMNVPDPKIFKSETNDNRPEVTEGGSLNLVYHGTMAERLGVDLIIRAVAQLRGRVPCAKLHLWGGGDDLKAFQRLAGELGASEAVSFNTKGFPLQELPHHLKAMHLGVLGNRRSVAGDLMLPVKLLEYIAMRIPAVVPRLKTIESYFDDDMVTYYEPENVRSMTDALYRLYCSPVLRAKQAESAAKFLEQHGWERQGADFVAFYRALVEN